MKRLNTLRILPLVGLLGVGLMLSPMAATADRGDRGAGAPRFSQSHKGPAVQYRDGHRLHRRDPGEARHGGGHRHDDFKRVRKGHRRPAHGHHDHGHGHRKKHHGHHHGPARTIVVHDHFHYDPFRFLLGLRLDNVDIIYRDY